MRRSAIVVGIVLLTLGAAVPGAGAFDAPAAQEDLTCEFPVTETDATGTEVTVDAEPERVVTLGGSATQTMWELGASEKVVGVSQFATYLDGAEDREVVTAGNPAQVDVEAVLTLEPDLVLVANIYTNDTVRQLRDAGLTAYRAEAADSLTAVFEKTETIGRLTGECESARETVDDMRERIDTVSQAVEGQDEPRVLWGTGSGYSAGPNTFIGQAIDVAGGHNIAADANSSSPYPQLSEEFIAEQDPEFVVVGVPATQMDAEKSELVPEDSVVRNTTAYEQGNVVAVNINHVSQPAPRIVEPVTQMAQAFHPEAYAEANATTTTTTTEASETTTVTDTTAADGGDGSDGSSNGSVPGFGVATALVAFVGAALLARRM